LEMDGDRVADGRVVLSGAAPVPWRSKAVEDVIRGRRLEGQTLEDAAQAAVEGADPLPGNTYKIDLFKGVIREELAAIAGQED